MRFIAVRSAAASLVGGLLLVVAFPPFAFSPAAPVGAGILLWAWRTAPTRRVVLGTAYGAGLAFFGGLFWWLTNVELIAFLPLLLVQAAFFLWPGWVAWHLRERSGWVWVGGVVGAWALSEAARVRTPMGGFPWGVVGLTIEPTPLLSSAHVVGATGWSVLIVGLAATVVMVIERRMRPAGVAIAAGLVAIVGVVGAMTATHPDGHSLEVAVVQGNSPCPGSTCPDERRIIFENHLALTREIPSNPDAPELLVWPESSTGFLSDPLANPEIAALIGAEARRLNAHILVGGDRLESADTFVNSNVLFDPAGEVAGEYRKTHPVPFGEYVPARPLFEWIPALDQVPRDMVRGDGPVTFDVAGVSVGSVISYEGSFARYPRGAVRDGAGVVVVATNQASFGDSPASDQFLAMSRVRAAELGTDVVHAAVTGRSAILHADGRIDGPTGLFTSETLRSSVVLREAGLTPYGRAGDVLQALASVAGLMIVVAGRLEGAGRTRS